jgi:hypothetical protein
MIVEQRRLVTPPQGPLRSKEESTRLTPPPVSQMMVSLVSEESCVFYHFTPATLTHLLEASGFIVRIDEASRGAQHCHALKHSLLRRLTRLHGPRGGRLRYYLLKPLFHPWEWVSTRWGGGSSMQVCAERPVAPPS